MNPLAVPATQTHPVGAADPATVVAVQEERGQALFGFARRLGLSDEEASDAVQEAFLRMWHELQRGTVIVRPDAWAFRAVYRLSMDEHRWRRRIERLLPRLRPTRSPAASEDRTDRLAAWAEVDLLPPRQRQVVYLRYRADLAFEEVGTVMGISASAARSHCTMALATLRRRFATVEETR
jgi:RNA polymerase sigma factor (sigma-70 family)